MPRVQDIHQLQWVEIYPERIPLISLMVPPLTEEDKATRCIYKWLLCLPLHSILKNFQAQRTRNPFSVVFSELAPHILSLLQYPIERVPLYPCPLAF